MVRREGWILLVSLLTTKKCLSFMSGIGVQHGSNRLALSTKRGVYTLVSNVHHLTYPQVQRETTLPLRCHGTAFHTPHCKEKQ